MAIKGHYVDGFLQPVPEANREAYTKMSETFARVMGEYGMIHYVESWQDDVPEGKTNSFHTAVLRKEGEAVVFAFCVWPDKATRDKAWAEMDSHPEMKDWTPETMPFDAGRMIYGGFVPFVNV
jgi:uncharacterized protein YbaA (DUF1428 family)